MSDSERRQSAEPSAHEMELLAVIRDCMKQMDEHREAIAELADVRVGLLHQARGRMPVAEIARRLRISRQQVHRLLRRDR